MQPVHYNPRMLAYIGAADAYCTGFAGKVIDVSKPYFCEVLDMRQYYVQPEHVSSRNEGSYTEETEMALAMAQLLTRDATGIISTREIARQFVGSFMRGGKRYGYGALENVLINAHEKYDHDVERGFEIEIYRTTISRQVMLTPAIVCGVIPDVREGQRIAKELGKLFHASVAEMSAISLLVLLSHYALYTDSSFREFATLYRRHLEAYIPPVYHYWYEKDYPDMWMVGYEGGHGVVGNIVYFVSHVLRRDFLSMRLMLDYCLRKGGVVDTAAALVWGIASARRQGDVIPEFFMEKLEGIDFLLQQGEQLVSKFSR